ncbi:MAG: hypothetical protein HY719_10010 [Planctomycetes bacterium]|nr:hypothetical protein [Planctomycetota bacterium]
MGAVRPGHNGTFWRAARRAATGLALVAPLLLAAGCVIHRVKMSPEYEGPAPLPPDVAARFAPWPERGPVTLTRAPPLRGGEWLGRFTARDAAAAGGGAPRDVTFEYFEARAAEAGPAPTAAGARPLIIVSPILGGKYRDARTACRWFARDGCHAAFVYRPLDMLDVGDGVVRVEQRLVEMVRDTRAVLDWLLARPEIDAARVASWGVSLGAIRNTLLAAAEPRIRAHALALGGGDIPDILARADDRGVRRFFARWKAKTGMDRPAVVAAVRADLLSDPLALAPYVDARRVLLFLGTEDRVVPFDDGVKLALALGGPRTILLPCGHYTALFFVNYAYARVREFFDERFAAPPSPPAENHE